MPITRETSVAAINFLQKSSGIVPTTLQEAFALREIVTVLENVAKGIIVVDVRPAAPPPSQESDVQPTPPRRKRRANDASAPTVPAQE